MQNDQLFIKPNAGTRKTVQDLQENVELPVVTAFKSVDRKKLSKSIPENANNAENADIANTVFETNCLMSIELE